MVISEAEYDRPTQGADALIMAVIVYTRLLTGCPDDSISVSFAVGEKSETFEVRIDGKTTYASAYPNRPNERHRSIEILLTLLAVRYANRVREKRATRLLVVHHPLAGLNAA